MPLLRWNLALVIVAQACQASSLLAEAEQNETVASEKSDSLTEMRQRADGVMVTAPDGGESHRQPLQGLPLFRYSDPRRTIRDAALWGFGERGRPAALMKTEVYSIDGGTMWVYCLASLSDRLIEAKWDDGAKFQSQEPGLELRAIPNGPRPGGTAAVRLVQLKRLTDRFSATIQNGVDNREPMRLMPTPICRYDDPEAGLIDGAVFGYTMGTNPDVLLVIELHGTAGGVTEWRGGAACMTSAGLVVRMDDTEILSHPYDAGAAGQPRDYHRWMWRRVILR